jgi:hypothetical protein
MSIIGKLIRSSTGLNSNQRKRWKKQGTIPWQVLSTIWNWGIEFCEEPPGEGMSVERFVVLLWVYAASATEEKNRKAALHLYYDMVQFELMPDWRKKLRPRKPVVRFRTRNERVVKTKKSRPPDKYF